MTLAKGGDLASVRSAAQTALKAQIKSINLTTDDSETPTLRISTVGNTIYSLLGVLDYANLRFQRPDGKRRGRKRGGICFGGGDSK